MKISRKIFTALMVGLLTISNTQIARSEPVFQNALNFKKGDCGLTVEKPHISKSLLNRKDNPFAGVKVNVYSECIYAQQSVDFQIELLKKGRFGWQSVNKFPYINVKPKVSPFKIEIKDAYVKCISSKKSKYVARASAQVTIGGKIYASPTIYSLESDYINCGT